jgi:hypothetical protein
MFECPPSMFDELAKCESSSQKYGVGTVVVLVVSAPPESRYVNVACG